MAEPQIRYAISAHDKSRAAFQSFGASVRKSKAELEAMDRTSRTAFGRFTGGLKASAIEVSGMVTSLRGLAAAYGVFAAGSFIRNAVRDLGDLKDNAERAGISITKLQELTYAAKQNGGSQADIVDLFQALNRKLGEANTKGNDLKKILEASGVALTDANGRARESVDVFDDIADLIASTTDEQKRALLLQAAFNRSAQESIPLLAGGSAELRRLAREAHEAGVIVDEGLVGAAARFDDRISKGTERLKGMAETAIAYLAKITEEADKNYKDFQAQQNEAASRAASPLGTLDALEAKRRELMADIARMEADPDGMWPIGARKSELEEVNKQIQQIAGGLDRIRRVVKDLPSAPDLSPFPTDSPFTKFLELKIPTGAETPAPATPGDDNGALQRITDVIEALEHERAQLGRTAKEQEIYNALKDAGIDRNSVFGQTIVDLTSKLYDERDALGKLSDEMDTLRDDTRGFLGDLASGLREGASLTDTLANAFGNLSTKLQDRALDDLTDLLLGKKGTTQPGLLGNWLGIGGPAPAGAADPAALFERLANAYPQPAADTSVQVSPVPPIRSDRVRDNIDILEPILSGATGGKIPITTGTQAGRSGAPDILHVRKGLLDKYETIQGQFGRAVPIVSGYRDPLRNMRAGGAKHSQHMLGNAIDLDVGGMPIEERQRLIALARQNDIGGIGVYKNSLHFDMGRKRQWGPNHRSDSVPEWAQGPLNDPSKFAQQFDASSRKIATDFQHKMTEVNPAIATDFGASFASLFQGIGEGGAAGGSNILSSILGIAGMFGGFFADGGRPPRGKVSIVGENGPEWLIGDGASTVIPGARMGGTNVTMGGHTINIQGSADENTIKLMRRELDARDAKNSRKMSREIGSVTANYGSLRG